MISEEDIERAVDYLRESAGKAATARATRLYLEQWLKSKKAMLQALKVHEGIGVSEVFALAHPEYERACADYRIAVEEDERYRFLREAASIKVQAWQTESANERGTRI